MNWIAIVHLCNYAKYSCICDDFVQIHFGYLFLSLLIFNSVLKFRPFRSVCIMKHNKHHIVAFLSDIVQKWKNSDFHVMVLKRLCMTKFRVSYENCLRQYVRSKWTNLKCTLRIIWIAITFLALSRRFPGSRCQFFFILSLFLSSTIHCPAMLRKVFQTAFTCYTLHFNLMLLHQFFLHCINFTVNYATMENGKDEGTFKIWNFFFVCSWSSSYYLRKVLKTT